ncbi:MAG: hypothetical protein ABI947_11635 [Chloroflexota bacterium]
MSVALVLAVLLAKNPSRAATDQNYCLNVSEGVSGGRVWLANPDSGATTENKQGEADLAQLEHSAFSPDNKYLITTDDTTHISTIFENGSNRSLKTLHRRLGFAWSPDSQSFAYVWKDDHSQLWLTVSSVIGNKTRTQAIFTVPAKDITQFSWSSDGKFLMANSGYAQEGYDPPLDFYFWSVPDLVLTRIDTGLRVTPWYEPPLWSRRGHGLAFIGIDRQNALYLGLLSPTISNPVLFKLPALDIPEYIWSPDNSHLAFRLKGGTYAIFGIDGSVICNSGQSTGYNPQWAKDGQTIFFTEISYGYSGRQTFYLTRAFHIKTSTSDIILGNALNPFSYGIDNIIATDQNGKKTVRLINGEGIPTRTLVEAADEVLYSDWVNRVDRRFAVVIWRANNRDHLTWSDKSNNSVHELNETADHLYTSYSWNFDGAVFYTGIAQDNYYLAYLNLSSGQSVHLVNYPTQIVYLDQDSTQMYFWYKGSDGNAMISAYHFDGKVGDVNQLPTANLNLRGGSLFWSPNKQRAVFLADTVTGHELYMLSKSPPSVKLISRPDTEFAAIKWSPDGSMVAFAQSVDFNYSSVFVSSADDLKIQPIGTFPSLGVGLLGITWQACP